MDNIDIVKIRRRILKARIINQENNCWECAKGIRDGYPEMMYKGKTYRVSRLSIAAFKNNPMFLYNKQLWALHKCDNKACVNPDHLYIGTWVENNMDIALRNPDASKKFMETSAKIFAEKYGIRYWRKVKNVNKVLEKIKKAPICDKNAPSCR